MKKILIFPMDPLHILKLNLVRWLKKPYLKKCIITSPSDNIMALYKEKKKHRGPAPLLERQSSINDRKRSFTIILIILIITLRISFLNAQKSFFNIDKMIFCLQKLSVSPSSQREGLWYIFLDSFFLTNGQNWVKIRRGVDF